MPHTIRFRGTLIPIGGAENKGLDDEDSGFDFIEEGILARVVKESNQDDPAIVVVPTASRIPDTVSENYRQAFSKLGCERIQVLNIRRRNQADAKASLAAVREADIVLFTGGDQSRITRFIAGTKLHELLHERLQAGSFVLAGTSAGAMSMSAEMIAGGSATESMLKGAVLLSKGMGYMPQLVIDTHFIRRGRFGRLAEAVATFPDLIGVGLAEDTGLVISEGNEIEVIGSGMVVVFDPGKLTHNRHDVLDDGIPMSMGHLITHILARGDRFTIDKRSLAVKAIPADPKDY